MGTAGLTRKCEEGIPERVLVVEQQEREREGEREMWTKDRQRMWCTLIHISQMAQTWEVIDQACDGKPVTDGRLDGHDSS